MLTRILIISFILTNVSLLISQTRAITEFNDTIYIYDNGTWSYEDDEVYVEEVLTDFFDVDIKIDTIKQLSAFNPSSNKEVKTSINQFSFKYFGENWKRVPPGSVNDEAEFAFQHRHHDLWSIFITEETEIGMANIFKIAKNTMEETLGTEVVVKKAEMRSVNGKNILRGVMELDISGISMTFDSYYFSDERGTSQLTTWTSTNVWRKYEEEIIDFLNGLIINEL